MDSALSEREKSLNKARAEYKSYNRRKVCFMLLFLALILFLGAYIVTVGPLNLSVRDVYKIIFSRIFPGIDVSGLPVQVVWNIRIPRIVAGLLSGFGIGICGCVMQAVLKNPMASPFTLGISSGANFGVALAAVLGVGLVQSGPYLIIGNAFIGAMVCSLFIIMLASFKGASSETMVLAGIGINYLFGAMSDLLRYFATDEQLRMMVSWGMGDLAAFSWKNFPIMLVVFVVCIPLLYLNARDLDIMIAGDETAKSLGINANRVRVFSMIVASLLVATIVCFTGTIGFIGLVAPHVVRMIIGTDHKYLFPASGLVGAALLMIADFVGLNILPATVIPTGIMTSVLGVPFFLYLVVNKKKREYW